jgi:hypothetical protein
VGEHSFLGTAAKVFSKEDETSADYNPGLPVVAFRFSDDFKKEFPHLRQGIAFPLPTYLNPMLFSFVSEEMRVLTRPSNNLKLAKSKAIHHPQLSPPTQRRQNRNPARRGARKHEF